MNITKVALLLVVLVDIMGQGLLYPILTTLMLDPGMQLIQFLENICMAGGLFALAGAGPGAFALDNLRR